MDWSDRGIVLSARKHGESSAIVSVLTRAHGRHAGLVRGGAGRRARGIYEPGNEVALRWRARLDEHLGTFSCELLASHAARLLDDRLALAALAAACALADAVLPEREPYAAVHDALAALLAALHRPGFAEYYVRWELDLLAELGFGLDLSACAATGLRTGLAFVSPRTGRAVSGEAGAPYRDRLLPLPAFLLGSRREEGAEAPPPAEILAGLRLTGYFLERHVFAPQDKALPPARTRLVDRMTGSATISRV